MRVKDVSPKGAVNIEFFYEGNKFRSNFLITSEMYPNVLGRDVLGMLCFDWNNVFGELKILI